MNEKIKNHLTSFCKSMEMGTTDSDFETVLRNVKPIYEFEKSDKWGCKTLFTVIEIEGFSIGFEVCDNRIACTTSIDLSTVCEVEKKQKLVDFYEPKKELTHIAVICKNSEDFNAYVRRQVKANVLNGILATFTKCFEHDGTVFYKVCCLEDTNSQTFHNWSKTEYVEENEYDYQHIVDYIYIHCIPSELKQNKIKI